MAKEVSHPDKSFQQLGERFGQIFGDSLIDPQELAWGEVLGKGAFAVVRRCCWQPKTPAQDPENGVEQPAPLPVAVKELRPDIVEGDEHDVKTFFAETQLLKKINHPHIVAFIGVVKRQEDGLTKIGVVQEYMNSGSLNTLLVKQAKDPCTKYYSERDGLKWMLQIARGLQHLHTLRPGRVSVIHRDLKPHNILLHRDASGVVTAKLADFGLSALVQKQKLDNASLPETVSKETSNSWSYEGSLQSRGLQSGKNSMLNSNLVTRFSILTDLLRSMSSNPNVPDQTKVSYFMEQIIGLMYHALYTCGFVFIP